MRIKVGDVILDAYRDEIIAQNYAVNRLGDIETRQGSYSNDFELPLTSKNRDALGFPSDINSNSRKPYQKVSATLIDSGTPIAEGYLKYTLTANNNIRCSFFATNVEWFALIKDKKLVDINLSDYDHEWTIDSISTAIIADKNSGYTYPIIDYGEFGTEADYIIDGTTLYPAMFVRTVIERLFFDIGWKVEGEMIDHPLYKRLIIPFSAESFTNSETYIEDNTQTLQLDDQQFTETNPDVVCGDEGLEWVYPVDWALPVVDPSELDIITTPGNYDITVILNYEIEGTSCCCSNIVDHFFAIYVNGISRIATKIVVGDVATQRELSLKNEYLSVGDTISVRFNGHVKGLSSVVVLDVFKEGSSLNVLPSSESIGYGATINMNKVLPDMTQEDLIKYLVFIFGAIPQANNNSKTINFSLFRSIKNNIPNAIDWSNKIDISKSQEIDFTELLDNYGQVSIMTYAEDENDAELSAYESETGKRFGEGQFTIQNEHLASREAIYEAPFTPMININSFSNTLYIPQIRFKGRTAEEDDVEPRPKIAILSKNISISSLSGGFAGGLAIKDPNSPDFNVVNSIPFCWFAKTQYITEIDSMLDSLAFDQINFLNAVGNPLIDRFLVDYEDIFNSVKYYKAFFHLNEVDIANLDFTVPVFIDRLKSYFYISNIKNYQGSGSVTECELVKITKSVEDLIALSPDNVFIDNDLIVFIDNDGESFIDA